eukprot:6211978-Pleurochrysis_carterae.AAC.2
MAPLHAQSCLKCSATFPFVYPYETDQRAIHGHFRSVDGGPAAIVVMIGYLGTFRRTPSQTVLCHCLLSRAWVVGDFVDCECAARFAPPCRFSLCRTESEQRRRAP